MNAQRVDRVGWPAVVLAATLGCSARPPTLGSETESEGSGSEVGSTSGSTTAGDDSSAGDTSTGDAPAPTDKVDVLFVIDNSASMGEEQAKLALALAGLEFGLQNDLQADYRVAVTTTDSGNPAGCSSPENGGLVLTSCVDRLENFIFQGATTTDRQSACTDVCPADLSGLETVPTTTDSDPEPKPRPWVQWSGGVDNLPEGVGVVDALQCFVPQGIDGCGFESPLESIYKAVVRSGTAGDPSYDFLREDAVLAIIVLTDEEDCSFNTAYPSVFLPDGNKVFWSTPDAPTSAICWNAGVACSGEGPIYDDCVGQNHDIDGNPDVEADAAVIHPVTRYTELVEELRASKSLQGRGVVVAAIAGVPVGYENGADLVYQDVPEGTPMDPEYQINFGIGPGCQSAVAEAVPPVRLREFAEAFAEDRRNLYSVCSDDYGPIIATIIDRIGEQMRP